MRFPPLAVCLYILTVTAILVAASTSQAQSPWDGTWQLDAHRSSRGAQEAAADAYRFSLAHDGSIRWEIPSLGEVVTGHVDGQPMPIHRTDPDFGLSLAVTRDGEWGLAYTVWKDGKIQGGGRMMLVEGGSAWVDLTWGGEHAQPGLCLVYVKQSSPNAK